MMKFYSAVTPKNHMSENLRIDCDGDSKWT